MKTLATLIRWVFVSSTDPEKWSLTVKAALLGVIPWIMQAVGFACGLHFVCPAVDATELGTIAVSISNLVYLGLSAVATVGFLYGLGRKIWRSAAGENAAMASAQ